VTPIGGPLTDEEGRTLLVRGVNLGGNSKIPSRPDGATHLRGGFYDHRTVSFIDRPFPLSEADSHFERLRRWGFGLVRLLVTWEAVEHAGPGQYDQRYLEYLDALVAKAGRHGIDVIVDLHQDVWSRFTGGSGAPGWTLEATGMDLRRIDETGAAITHQAHVQPYETMIWSTNATKLAAATMFTLFFGARDFAPNLRFQDEPIGDFLRRHYLGTLRSLAVSLRSHSNVLGYDPMNEPHAGYIGCTNLDEPPGEPRIGTIPTPLQSMALGAGIPQEVTVWRFGSTGSRPTGKCLVNPARVSLWRGKSCPWLEHGVWEVASTGEPRILEPSYFRRINGEGVDFASRYYQPFLTSCVEVIREAHPEATLYLEPAQGTDYVAPLPEGRVRIVSSPHWYDGAVLMLKRYNAFVGVDSLHRRVVIGQWAIRRSYRRQIERLIREGVAVLGGAATVVGETGIPFDLNGRQTLRRGTAHSDGGKPALSAMNRTLRTMEDSLVSYIIWNYTSTNSGEHGDGWNEENLSIYRKETGGRALAAIVRPYVRAVAGTLRRMRFTLRTRLFEAEFDHDPQVSAPTEIFVPNLQYPSGLTVEVSDGHWETDRDAQLLRYYHSSTKSRHWLRLRPGAESA